MYLRLNAVTILTANVNRGIKAKHKTKADNNAFLVVDGSRSADSIGNAKYNSPRNAVRLQER